MIFQCLFFFIWLIDAGSQPIPYTFAQTFEMNPWLLLSFFLAEVNLTSTGSALRPIFQTHCKRWSWLCNSLILASFSKKKPTFMWLLRSSVHEPVPETHVYHFPKWTLPWSHWGTLRPHSSFLEVLFGSYIVSFHYPKRSISGSWDGEGAISQPFLRQEL